MTLKPGSVITQGHRNLHGSIRPYDFLLKLHNNHGPISYRFWDKRRFQSKVTKLAMPKWPAHSGCKIIKNLESQTPSFLLTVNFHHATMTVNGHLLSSTAIVKRFQAKNILSPPEWQALLSVRISQSCGITKPMRRGYKAKKTVWWYLYPFWYNTGCDRQTCCHSKDRAMLCVARVMTRAKMQPCLTPTNTSNGSDSWPSTVTLADMPSWNWWRI